MKLKIGYRYVDNREAFRIHEIEYDFNLVPSLPRGRSGGKSYTRRESEIEVHRGGGSTTFPKRW